MVVTWHPWSDAEEGNVRCYDCGETIPARSGQNRESLFRITWVRVGYGRMDDPGYNHYLQMGYAEFGITCHLYWYTDTAYAALCETCLSRFCFHGVQDVPRFPAPHTRLVDGSYPDSNELASWLRTLPIGDLLNFQSAAQAVLRANGNAGTGGGDEAEDPHLRSQVLG